MKSLVSSVKHARTRWGRSPRCCSPRPSAAASDPTDRCAITGRTGRRDERRPVRRQPGEAERELAVFDTGVRQFRMAMGMVWGRRLDPDNIGRLVEDAHRHARRVRRAR